MLLIVLALVVALWLGVVTAVVAICAAAGRTDRVLMAGTRRERSAPATDGRRLLA
jgi:hypothetical protein